MNQEMQLDEKTLSTVIVGRPALEWARLAGITPDLRASGKPRPEHADLECPVAGVAPRLINALRPDGATLLRLGVGWSDAFHLPRNWKRKITQHKTIDDIRNANLGEIARTVSHRKLDTWVTGAAEIPEKRVHDLLVHEKGYIDVELPESLQLFKVPQKTDRYMIRLYVTPLSSNAFFDEHESEFRNLCAGAGIDWHQFVGLVPGLTAVPAT